MPCKSVKGCLFVPSVTNEWSKWGKTGGFRRNAIVTKVLLGNALGTGSPSVTAIKVFQPKNTIAHLNLTQRTYRLRERKEIKSFPSLARRAPVTISLNQSAPLSQHQTDTHTWVSKSQQSHWIKLPKTSPSACRSGNAFTANATNFIYNPPFLTASGMESKG